MLMIKINGSNEGIIEYNTRLMPVFTPKIVSFGSRMINKIQSRQQINSKYFKVNSNYLIVIYKQLTIENDVMFGRNVTVYDSDFH